MLREIYRHLNERSIKNRIYQLCKKLIKPVEISESDVSISCSFESDIDFS